MRTIQAFNDRRKVNPAPISLEIPVSLREVDFGQDMLGNLISPLTLFGDGRAPLDDLTRDLHNQLKDALERKLHHAVPLFSRLGQYLPWVLFKRIAITPTATGFATSHFTLLTPPKDLPLNLEALSGGTVRIIERFQYTPVCLHMGAAVLAMPQDDGLRIYLTYRENAVPTASAEFLLDGLEAELR